MTAATLEVHRLSREIPGAPGVLLPLPLCWDMEVRQRFGADYDDEDWFTAWDHGAIAPDRLSFSTINPQLVPAKRDRNVTCPDCQEWIHA